MIAWMQKKDGTYQREGMLRASRVHIQILRGGVWSASFTTHTQREAIEIIESAIKSGFVRAPGYRIIRKAADPEVAKKFQRLREKFVQSSRDQIAVVPTRRMSCRKAKPNASQQNRRKIAKRK
jgi:hypothetical protein